VALTKSELPVRHRRAIHPEPIDRDAMDRRFFGIMLVRSHAERASGNQTMLGRAKSSSLERNT
jgi:hypothetical protein